MDKFRRVIRDHWLEFVISAVGLQLIVTAVGLLLNQHPFTLALIGCAVLLLPALLLLIWELAHRPVVGGMQQWEQLRRQGGIILTLGLKSHEDGSTVLKVIREAQPQLVGFVGTQATAGSGVAKAVAHKVGLGADAWRELTVDPTNVAEVRAHVQQLIGWMEGKGVPRSKQLVDLTGGTAVVSVGAYMAAEDAKVDTIYVLSQYQDNKPLAGSQRVLPIATYAGSGD
jgi:hypothetical protein